MTTSLTSNKGEFLDRRLLEEEEEERMADLRAIDYDDDRNYAHDIEQFEYEIAAGDYIPEDCDYDDDVEEEDYEDVMDYYYEQQLNLWAYLRLTSLVSLFIKCTQLRELSTKSNKPKRNSVSLNDLIDYVDPCKPTEQIVVKTKSKFVLL